MSLGGWCFHNIFLLLRYNTIIEGDFVNGNVDEKARNICLIFVSPYGGALTQRNILGYFLEKRVL
jgi:hypothetical protein